MEVTDSSAVLLSILIKDWGNSRKIIEMVLRHFVWVILIQSRTIFKISVEKPTTDHT
jgi:hypothetical protein